MALLSWQKMFSIHQRCASVFQKSLAASKKSTAVQTMQRQSDLCLQIKTLQQQSPAEKNIRIVTTGSPAVKIFGASLRKFSFKKRTVEIEAVVGITAEKWCGRK